MIIDCFTHTWQSSDQLGRCKPSIQSPIHVPSGEITTTTAQRQTSGISQHLAAAQPVTTTLVLGFKSDYLAAEIPNEQMVAYVKNHPDKLIGFAGIDPSSPRTAIAELRYAKEQLGMKGIAVAPAAQGFHPSSSQALMVYAQAAELHLPVIFHTGVYVTQETKLEFAQPVLLDEVARELPNLKIIIAHMGFPWVQQTIALLAKHPNVYSEISWLVDKPWQAYQALLSAYEHGVMDKLLFGSGFPQAHASLCIEALYSISHLCHGTNLPLIPREQLRRIVERDTLTLLGIHHSTHSVTTARPASAETILE